jgi:hypothetical protein
MKYILGHIWKVTLITLVGLAGSVIAGLMTYGSDIFDPRTAGFAYYVMYGFSTSFIFAFYHVRGLSNTITAAALAGVVFFIIATMWMPVINSLVWSFGVNFSVVVLAFLFERKLAYFKQWKFIVVGIIYGGLFVVLTLFVGIITRVEAMPPVLFQHNFMDGMWMGFGLGIGVEIAESIIHSIEASKH